MVQLGAEVQQHIHIDPPLDVVIGEPYLLKTHADELSAFEALSNFLDHVVEAAGCHFKPVFEDESVEFFVLIWVI